MQPPHSGGGTTEYHFKGGLLLDFERLLGLIAASLPLAQYEVAERMRALGWKQVELINSDLGSSAAIASARRDGFERVLSSVALGEVGIVGSREVSRLSRTDKDWCRLLEVCQIFGTLIADEQQVYDLNYLDDQLVLGRYRLHAVPRAGG